MILNGDRDELGRYVREMADLCGLRDWTINMMGAGPDNPKLFAAIERIHGRKQANFYIRETWPQQQPERIRQTVAHELVHLHVDPAVKSTTNLIAEQVPPAVYEVIDATMNERVEYAVDGIAESWAPSLPLPVREQEDVTPERVLWHLQGNAPCHSGAAECHECARRLRDSARDE